MVLQAALSVASVDHIMYKGKKGTGFEIWLLTEIIDDKNTQVHLCIGICVCEVALLPNIKQTILINLPRIQ